MRSPASLPFEECVLSVLGLPGGKDPPSSMLSSLASELAFNSLRDTCRRHAKQERTSPAAMHAVAWKSASVNKFGCETLSLSDHDWSSPLKCCQIKKAIHANHRATDRELGISAEGLTRHRVNKQYTKPHIFTSRLHLLKVLTRVFKDCPGSMEDKRVAVSNTHASMWISKAVPLLWFVQFAGGQENPDHAQLVHRAGPFTVGCLKLRKAGEVYRVESSPLSYILVETLEKLEFAKAKPLVDKDGTLVWGRDSTWMTLVDWLADFGIFSVAPQMLLGICNKMKLQGCGRLNHPHRVELFLKHLGRSEEWVQHVLENLEPWERKRKKKAEDEDEENQDSFV